MKSFHALSEADLAQFYLQHKGGHRSMPVTATRLYEDVQNWLSRCGLHHRLYQTAEIASEAYAIAQQIHEQSVVSSDADFEADVREGISDRRPELDEMARTGTEVARNTASALFRL